LVTSDSQIPNAVNIGRQECLTKCGIDAKTFDIRNVRLLLSDFEATNLTQRFLMQVTKAELLQQAFAGYLNETKGSS
jgi:hypothetical protein